MSAPKVRVPSETELMAARCAIAGDISSIALGRCQPSTAVLDAIIIGAVLAMNWQPPSITVETAERELDVALAAANKASVQFAAARARYNNAFAKLSEARNHA